MMRLFADETSDDATVFAMGAWLGDWKEWERFSEAWQAELNFPPKIGFFNNNEAMGKKGQFRSWSDDDRDKKLLSLANVIARYDLVGFLAPVGLGKFNSLYRHSIVPKRALRGILKWTDPYHFVCPCVIAQALGHQVEVARNTTDKVDFIFDDGVKSLEDCIANYPRLKTVLPVAAQNIAGTVAPGNDKEIVALQAADILAGQALGSLRIGKPSECLKLLQSKKIYLLRCMENQFDRIPNAISLVNFVWTVKRLEKAKKRGDGKNGKRKR